MDSLFETCPLAFCVIVSRRSGMLDNIHCVVSCTLKLLLVYWESAAMCLLFNKCIVLVVFFWCSHL